MSNLLLDLLVDRVDLVDEGANSAAFIKLYKRKECNNDMNFEEILAKMLPEHAEVVRAEIAKAKEVNTEELTKAKEDLMAANEELSKANADLAASKEALEKATCSTKKDEETEELSEEVMKSLDPSVQKFLSVMKSKADEAAKKAAEAEAEIQKAKDKAIEETAIAKAKDLKNLPVDEAKLVAVVKGASEEVFEILKAANEAIGNSGLFDEHGVRKGNHQTGDAWTVLEKKATDLAAEKKITKEAAFAEVIKNNPDLYREYLKGGNE